MATTLKTLIKLEKSYIYVARSVATAGPSLLALAWQVRNMSLQTSKAFQYIFLSLPLELLRVCENGLRTYLRFS